MVFYTTFNNNPFITWRSVSLLDKTGVPKKITDLPKVTDTLYHIMLYRVQLVASEIRTHNSCGDKR